MVICVYLEEAEEAMKALTEQEKDAVMNHFDATIGNASSLGAGFEAVWSKLNNYNNEVREVERRLLAEAQNVAQTTRMSYTDVLEYLTKVAKILYETGGK